MLTSYPSSTKDLKAHRRQTQDSYREQRKKMKAPPSLLVLCLAILAAALSILAVHVQPAQAGSRQPSAPPPPYAPQGPGSHCCRRQISSPTLPRGYAKLKE
ncbi:hypothetical protein U9M48_035227, partial [Paspalum notatum var. saurae]